MDEKTLFKPFYDYFDKVKEYYEKLPFAKEYQGAMEKLKEMAEKGIKNNPFFNQQEFKFEPAKFYEWCLEQAKKGVAEAQNIIGDCFYYGQNMKQDYSKAAEWYEKAAEQGLAIAQSNLATCYEFGQGISKNYNKALDLCEEAARQGLDMATKILNIKKKAETEKK